MVVAAAISKINGGCHRFIVWAFQLTQAKAMAIQKTSRAIICCKRMQKSELPNLTTSLQNVLSQLTVFLGQRPKTQALSFQKFILLIDIPELLLTRYSCFLSFS